MRLMVLLFPLVLAAPAMAFDDPPMTTLRVEVKTLNGKPVERASVIVRLDKGRSKARFGKKVITSYQLKTNQDGVAKIPPLPQGKFLIQVIAQGYQTFGGTSEIEEAERTVEVKLNPPQPQYSVHQ
ncbi:MAG TPA: carboxypeptidase regulatory-like domain-containing protein [Bryobacteraceae bacterium]|nr:carboxypeptidase regulatory-like domain-containing protein [Bryobacteraceae bacterium]